jgi:hypothetical protein
MSDSDATNSRGTTTATAPLKLTFLDHLHAGLWLWPAAGIVLVALVGQIFGAEAAVGIGLAVALLAGAVVARVAKSPTATTVLFVAAFIGYATHQILTSSWDTRESTIDLRGTSLVGADLRGADLRRADLRGADLSNTCLRGADLTGARLDGATFTGADVQGAKISAQSRPKAIGWGGPTNKARCSP